MRRRNTLWACENGLARGIQLIAEVSSLRFVGSEYCKEYKSRKLLLPWFEFRFHLPYGKGRSVCRTSNIAVSYD